MYKINIEFSEDNRDVINSLVPPDQLTLTFRKTQFYADAPDSLIVDEKILQKLKNFIENDRKIITITLPQFLVWENIKNPDMMGSGIWDTLSSAWDTFKTGASNAFNTVKNYGSRATDYVKNTYQKYTGDTRNAQREANILGEPVKQNVGRSFTKSAYVEPDNRPLRRGFTQSKPNNQPPAPPARKEPSFLERIFSSPQDNLRGGRYYNVSNPGGYRGVMDISAARNPQNYDSYVRSVLGRRNQ